MADQNENNQSITWNSGGTTFDFYKVNVTDTASAAASRLMLLQVGGIDKFAVRKDGALTIAGGATIGGNSTITGTLGVTGAFTAAAIAGTTGTFSGAVSGTTGTFSGALSATTGTFSGVIQGTNGTVGAPAFSFAGDPNTGMYLLSANVIRWGTNGVFRMQLNDTGDLFVTGNITASSDERFKKDWADLDADFIEKLAGVKMGTYTRADSGIRQVGVGAQSLQKVMSEAVGEDGEGMLSVAYGNAALAACVQLAREVCRLRDMIEAMK
jgi:hypothetical protein